MATRRATAGSGSSGSAPRLLLPPGARPLPQLGLGGSQEFLGAVTASLLGLPIAERQALHGHPATALAAEGTAAAPRTLVSLTPDPAHPLFPGSSDFGTTLVQTFFLLVLTFFLFSACGRFEAAAQRWIT